MAETTSRTRSFLVAASYTVAFALVMLGLHTGGLPYTAAGVVVAIGTARFA